MFKPQWSPFNVVGKNVSKTLPHNKVYCFKVNKTRNIFLT